MRRWWKRRVRRKRGRGGEEGGEEEENRGERRVRKRSRRKIMAPLVFDLHNCPMRYEFLSPFYGQTILFSYLLNFAQARKSEKF